MKKVISFIVIFIVLLFNSSLIIELLPDSDFKMRLRHFIHKDKLESLIALADKTEYTHIAWIKDDMLRAGIREGNKINWQESPSLEAFVSKVEAYDYSFVDITKGKSGNWLISGYTEILFLNDSRTKMKNIRTEFSYGLQPQYEQCTSVSVASSINGQCYVSLSDNWFLHRYWISLDTNDDQT